MKILTRCRKLPNCSRIIPFILLIAICISIGAYADDESAAEDGPEMLITTNPFYMLIGIYTGHIEKKVGEALSIWGEPTYFNIKAGLTGILVDSIETADDVSISVIKTFWNALSAWAIGVSGGVNYFPMKSSLVDGYISPGIAVLYSVINLGSIETELGPTPPLELTGTQIGINIGAGYRWIWDWFGLGIEARIGVAYSSYSFDAVFQYFDFTNANLIPSKFSPTFAAGLKMYIAL